MERYGLTKKDNIETPSEMFVWKMVTGGCSVSCGTGKYFIFSGTEAFQEFDLIFFFTKGKLSVTVL